MIDKEHTKLCMIHECMKVGRSGEVGKMVVQYQMITLTFIHIDSWEKRAREYVTPNHNHVCLIVSLEYKTIVCPYMFIMYAQNTKHNKIYKITKTCL